MTKLKGIKPWIRIVETTCPFDLEEILAKVKSKQYKRLLALCYEVAAFHPSRGDARGCNNDEDLFSIFCGNITGLNCKGCPAIYRGESCSILSHPYRQWADDGSDAAVEEYYQHILNQYVKAYKSYYGTKNQEVGR